MILRPLCIGSRLDVKVKWFGTNLCGRVLIQMISCQFVILHAHHLNNQPVGINISITVSVLQNTHPHNGVIIAPCVHWDCLMQKFNHIICKSILVSVLMIPQIHRTTLPTTHALVSVLCIIYALQITSSQYGVVDFSCHIFGVKC